MTSFKNCVLLILLTIALIIVVDAAKEGRAIPSEEEKKELKKQLKAINKPAIKSFKTEHGEIFDCIDIHKQLAFDHPLLKNHSVQLKPTTVGNNISERFGPFQLMQEGISCPDGTVIVKRITMQNLMHAQRLKSMGLFGSRHFLTERNNTDSNGQSYLAELCFGPRNFSGAEGYLNLWEPQVSQDQVSLAFLAVGGGSKENFASIAVGWMVNPSLYQNDHVHLYVSWTMNGSNRGCYDLTCPGFVQVSKNIPLGVILKPISVYDGSQYEIRLKLQLYGPNRDWWFSFKGESIGYWPGALFKDQGLANRAKYASWGGQTYSPNTEKTPIMGSGHWPSEGLYKAAYVNSLKVIGNKGTVMDPGLKDLKVYESNPNCYKAILVHEDKVPWLRAVYYGGPPGCIGQ
ncbi:Protein neprosin [Cardamine amara subsp. amara]|uniref:Protein neprosin n=1 Tax=Cardamine amara subsp. amara TaxID=228776 RepID=A0ABD1BR72_CARAN